MKLNLRELKNLLLKSDWKTAHVAPVYKKGPKYNPENYRPIDNVLDILPIVLS
jgi:hypothetical protein